MVHKKYIKRDGKIFGPYLYENYRENGVTKTRYLGIGKSRKLRVNKILFIVLGLFLVALILGGIFLPKANFSLENLKGELFSEQFDVSVSIANNHAPEFLDIDKDIFVCENRDLNYFFKITDFDGDELTSSLSDLDPFYMGECNRMNNNDFECNIVSWVLNKEDHIKPKQIPGEGWATYPEEITISDGDSANYFNTNIVVIEVNNAPNLTNIPTQTVWTKGDDSFFNYQVKVNDKEEGNEFLGKLKFNLSFLDSTSFFNINSTGFMKFNATNRNDLVGVYNLRVCVNDSGLTNTIHPNISLCWNEGQNADPKFSCNDFGLTITNNNRPPNITSYYPNLTFSTDSINELYFNISKYDPDWTIPDSYWYLDGSLAQYVEGRQGDYVDEFIYAFGCGISGEHKLMVVVSDGLLNSSVQWNISVINVPCPTTPSGGGGGGGGGKLVCKEKWVCGDWSQCENFALSSNQLDYETNLLIKERCSLFNWDASFCGFQTKNCVDLKHCKTNLTKPGNLQECYYTVNPSCNDGIKNCHEGSCEVLIDCGGPCDNCPSCNDGIKNQGETGVDCGGPCKVCLEKPIAPFLFKSFVTYSLIAFVVLILFLAGSQIWKYFSFKKLEKKKKQEAIESSQIVNLFFIVLVVVALILANSYIMDFSGSKNLPDLNQGVLYSYGLLNSVFSNLGIFISGPIVSGDGLTQLIIGDDTDEEEGKIRYTICNDAFCVKKEKPSSSVWTVNFYAIFENNGGGAISDGACQIRFDGPEGYSGWSDMVFNTDRYAFSSTFDYKGEWDFEIQCSKDSSSVSTTEPFVITNTVPYIIQTAAGHIDFNGDGDRDDLQCNEDELCYYDFSKNVSDDDTNDDWVYGVNTINTTLTKYSLDADTGMLIINITNSINTGNNKQIELNVKDSESTLRSALLFVDVKNVNDAPVFINLENKTFNSGDLFEYIIQVGDEENNYPFKFNIDYLDCSVADCDLFDGQYTFDARNGKLNISFSPVEADVGSYLINFSVMDNSSLGNKTTSQVVNFTVEIPIWRQDIELNYGLTEDQLFSLDLTTLALNPIGISFSNKTNDMPSFSLNEEGIISFSPKDIDIGYHEIEIIASNSEASSLRTFNFTVTNINDLPVFGSLQIQGAIISGKNYSVFENTDTKVSLFVNDDDLIIPASQKAFYNEDFNVSLKIIGPNSSLFKFNSGELFSTNQKLYSVNFIPRAADVGQYNLSINVTDNSNQSFAYGFILKILARPYDPPNITFPDSLREFSLIENQSANLIFKANHTVGDNLRYKFYINGTLKDSLLYYGDNTDLIWNWAPLFTEETYDNKTNLTLIVENPHYPEFNISRTWNLTINHSNAPPEFIDEIQPRSFPYNLVLEENLGYYFRDIDHEDLHYKQNVSFVVSSNSSPSDIIIGEVSENWTITLSSSRLAPFKETLNITAYDLDENGNYLRNVTSNNFVIELLEPEKEPVPTPSPSPDSGGGGGGSSKIIALKIIVPGKISAFQGDKIDIPISLLNTGKTSFKDIGLFSSAFKDGNSSNEITTSLDRNSFSVLNPGQQENLTLSAILNTDKLGDYEILINFSSKNPIYFDWGKIYINLQSINESNVGDLIVFTEELIVENPACVEITEIIDEAKELLDRGDLINAKVKTEEAIAACKESISQVGIPSRSKSMFYALSIYLAVAIAGAFAIGIIYYIVQRRKIRKKYREVIEESKNSE
ncbi:MAG: hypothetical protein WC438_01960 [Candidatus Pacearchaeota archaeon]